MEVKSNRLQIYVIDSVGAHRGMHYYNFPLVSELSKISAGTITLISTVETANNNLRPKNVFIQGDFRNIYGEGLKIGRGLRYGLSLLRISWRALCKKPDLAHFHFFQIVRNFPQRVLKRDEASFFGPQLKGLLYK